MEETKDNVRPWLGSWDQYQAVDDVRDLIVRAQGPKITITLNGTPTVEYEEKQPDLQPAREVGRGLPNSTRNLSYAPPEERVHVALTTL